MGYQSPDIWSWAKLVFKIPKKGQKNQPEKLEIPLIFCVASLSIRSMGLWSTRASAGALKSQHVVKHVSSWLQVTPWQDHDTIFLHICHVTSVISAPQHAVQDRCTPRCFRWRYRWSAPELCGVSLQLLPKKRKEQCHTVQSLCLVGNGWNRNGHLGRLVDKNHTKWSIITMIDTSWYSHLSRNRPPSLGDVDQGWPPKSPAARTARGCGLVPAIYIG